jgi:hypothetical protein
MKAQEDPLADRHECISVLFADLAGFTEAVAQNVGG